MIKVGRGRELVDGERTEIWCRWIWCKGRRGRDEKVMMAMKYEVVQGWWKGQCYTDMEGDNE